MKISEKTIKALEILRETTYDAPMTARRFSELMWTDSKYHNKRYKGNGTVKGCGMYLSAGSYLTKLSNTGYVHKLFGNYNGYYISENGKELIKNER